MTLPRWHHGEKEPTMIIPYYSMIVMFDHGCRHGLFASLLTLPVTPVWLLKFNLLKLFFVFFPSKKFFRKESFQFSSRLFSFSPNCPWSAEVKSAELVSCIRHISGVVAIRHRRWRVRIPQSTIVLPLFRYSLTRSYFVKRNNRDFLTKT